MKKMIVLALLVAFMMPIAASQVLAADEKAQTGIVDAGNNMCPVMGGPVSGKDFVVYQGKRYGLCCPGCDKKFLSDPEKYIAQMKMPSSTAGVTPIDPASAEMQKDMEQRAI
ncbi:MAG: YHS domain-containing protein [Candidatus Omnitrophota bacterium]